MAIVYEIIEKIRFERMGRGKLEGANVLQSTNNGIQRARYIKIGVTIFIKEFFSFPLKLHRVLRFTGLGTKTSTGVSSNNNVELSLDVCCNKKTLAKLTLA